MNKTTIFLLTIIVICSCPSNIMSASLTDINYEGYYMMSRSAADGDKSFSYFCKLYKNPDYKKSEASYSDYSYAIRSVGDYSAFSSYLKIDAAGKVKAASGSFFSLSGRDNKTIRGIGRFDKNKQLSGTLTYNYYREIGLGPDVGIAIPIAPKRYKYNWSLIPATEKNLIEGVLHELNKTLYALEHHFILPPHYIKYMSFEAAQSFVLSRSVEKRLVFNLIRNGDVQYDFQPGLDSSFKYCGDYSHESIHRAASVESHHRQMTDPELKYFILRIDLNKLKSSEVDRPYYKDRKWALATLKDPEIVERLTHMAKKTGDMRLVEKITEFFKMFLPEHPEAMALVNEWENVKERLSGDLPLLITGEGCHSNIVAGRWNQYINHYSSTIEMMSVDELVFPPLVTPSNSRLNMKKSVEVTPIDFSTNCTVSASYGEGKWIWQDNELTFLLKYKKRYSQEWMQQIQKGVLFHDKIIGRSEIIGRSLRQTWVLKRAEEGE